MGNEERKMIVLLLRLMSMYRWSEVVMVMVVAKHTVKELEKVQTERTSHKSVGYSRQGEVDI